MLSTEIKLKPETTFEFRTPCLEFLTFIMTRNGKIARLPRTLRIELNQRLARNEDGATLLDWFNDAPDVKAGKTRSNQKMNFCHLQPASFSPGPPTQRLSLRCHAKVQLPSRGSTGQAWSNRLKPMLALLPISAYPFRWIAFNFCARLPLP
jgi:hypothetical protein